MAGAAQHVEQGARLLIQQHPIDDEQLHLSLFSQQACSHRQITGYKAHYAFSSQASPSAPPPARRDDDNMRSTTFDQQRDQP